MIKEILEYVPLVTIIFMTIYFLQSISLKQIQDVTSSVTNVSSKKSLSVIFIFIYIVFFSFITFNYDIFFPQNKVVSKYLLLLLEIFGAIIPYIIYCYYSTLFKNKFNKILLKENIYKPSKGNNRSVEFAIILICICSVIHAITFNLQLENLILSELKLQIFFTFFYILKVLITFMASGSIISFGALHKLTKFKFHTENDILEGYLIGVNKEYYLIKEKNKKSIALKKEQVSVMEFLS